MSRVGVHKLLCEIPARKRRQQRGTLALGDPRKFRFVSSFPSYCVISVFVSCRIVYPFNRFRFVSFPFRSCIVFVQRKRNVKFFLAPTVYILSVKFSLTCTLSQSHAHAHAQLQCFSTEGLDFSAFHCINVHVISQVCPGLSILVQMYSN